MARNDIEYKKVMLDEDEDAFKYVKDLGYDSAPVTVVRDGDEVVDHWSGFFIEKINDLAKRGAA